jgi:hypothetical protein
VVIRRRGIAALIVAIVAQFAWAIVLLVGNARRRRPDTVLSAGEIFAVYGW